MVMVVAGQNFISQTKRKKVAVGRVLSKNESNRMIVV